VNEVEAVEAVEELVAGDDAGLGVEIRGLPATLELRLLDELDVTVRVGISSDSQKVCVCA